MKYSTRLSDAVHILVFIAVEPDTGLSSDAIATSVRTNPAYVRQIMSQLRRSGIIVSTRGRADPKLSGDPKDITLLDVYKAVEGDKPLLHLDTHTNPECGVGVLIQDSLKDFYDDIQASIEDHMSSITLSDIIERYYHKLQTEYPPKL